MPNPAACGYPDVSTTGTLPGVARQAVNGNVTLSTAGQVYENKTVTGVIKVTAPNVTIRNVKVTTGGWAIRCRPQDGNCSNLTIQDTEINLDGDLGGYGIVCENYTATRLFIHNGADGAYLCSNATIRDSLIALGPDANNDGWPDSNSFCAGSPQHFDGLSSDGGSHQVYDHNTIRNPCSQTSAILISTNSSAISSVRITNNLMAGGGYTLYCAATAGGTGGDPEVVTGNRIARTYRPQGGYYGPIAYCDSAEVFTGNVWDDTGASLGDHGQPPPPPPPPADRDGDGVPDSSDACPDTPGTQPNGCPPPTPPPSGVCDQACEDGYKATIADLEQQLAAMTASRDNVQALADAYKARAAVAEAIVAKVRDDVAP